MPASGLVMGGMRERVCVGTLLGLVVACLPAACVPATSADARSGLVRPWEHISLTSASVFFQGKRCNLDLGNPASVCRLGVRVRGRGGGVAGYLVRGQRAEQVTEYW